MNRDPIEEAGEPTSECDCCGKVRPLTRCWASGTETFACNECRGIEPEHFTCKTCGAEWIDDSLRKHGSLRNGCCQACGYDRRLYDSDLGAIFTMAEYERDELP